MPLPENTIILDDADAVAGAAAERIAALSADRSRERPAIALSGGSTPEKLYRLLASDAWRGKIDWSRIHWFWGDERFVPASDALSNERMVRAAMFDHVPAPAGLVHAPPTDAAGPDEAAARYEAELKRFYGADRLDPAQPLFDIVLLGIGDDGHTASLFPGKPALQETERWVVGVPEAGMKPFVPRITLTFPAIRSSRSALFLAVGAAKAEMLARVAAGDDLPSAHVRSDGKVEWLIDRAAAGGK